MRVDQARTRLGAQFIFARRSLPPLASLFRTAAAMSAPCSVKTRGSFPRPPRPFDVPIWHIKSANSWYVSTKENSAGKAADVAKNGLIGVSRRHAVEDRQIAVEHHGFAAEGKDAGQDRWRVFRIHVAGSACPQLCISIGSESIKTCSASL